MPEGGARTGALARSLRAMTVGAANRALDDHQAYADTALGEIDVQYQAAVVGVAGALPVWVEIPVEFPVPFVDAYDERDSPFSDPTFTFGVVFTANTEPAFVTAAVKAWDRDDQLYTGARIVVGAFRPGALEDAPFTGEIHMNFEGFGQPSPDDQEGE